MDIFGILTMIGGLALFLYGMSTMGDGLSKLSGGKLEQVLEKLTSKRIMAVLLGAGVTAVIQSSSATTVMVVGFVNSGIMKLQQAVGIIMGANIGTTITSWLLSLTAIEGDNLFIQLLKPSSFSPVLAFVGILLIMAGKTDKQKVIGNILLGFAILMTGMETMSGAVKPLASNEKFTGMLLMFSNPLLGMLAGALLTAVIQSSSASVGILQALCATGAVSFGSAIPIIMGQNIGTCVTAIISSTGASKNAKRASMIHLYFNLIGTLLFMVVFYGLNAFIHFSFLSHVANPASIAIVHSLFNVGTVVLLFPFGNLLVKLATISIPDKGEEEEVSDLPSELAILDERFLEKPAFAMELCRNAGIKMAEEARDSLYLALDLLMNYSDAKAERIMEMETNVDHYEDTLGSYLVKLSSKDLSQSDSRSLSVLLHCIGDFERISDHAVNLVESAQEMNQNKLQFSKRAVEELDIFSNAIREIVGSSVNAFMKNDIEAARMIEPLEQVIDLMNMEVKQRHIKRLRKGKCTMGLGLILQDICTNFERISDHCSNVGVCLIQISEDGYDTHEYLDELKETDAKWFKDAVVDYQKKYRLPSKDDKVEEDVVMNKEDLEKDQELLVKKIKKEKKEKQRKQEKQGKKSK